MEATGIREEPVSICNKCQKPVSDPKTGKDGELYHRSCGESIAAFE